jgi:hypothetical protein
MSGLAFHTDGVSNTSEVIDGYIGSPMYDVISEHNAALIALLLFLVGTWVLRRAARSGRPAAVRWVDAYRALLPTHRMLAWLLGASGAVHAGLVIGHEPSGSSVLYLADAVLMIWLTRRLLDGKPWRRWTRLVLIVSILGYALTLLGGEPPDQLGILTKLIEVAALAIAMTPAADRPLRRFWASTATVTVMVFIAIAAWGGAFSSGGGHHPGDVPAPGVLIPSGVDREPTAHERRKAADLYAATAAAIAKYTDPKVAATAGYNIANMYGLSFHAENATYKADDVVLDPARPETLVYAVADDGTPVLLGAMFEMGGIGESGPAVGGPLTVWHAHDHVCFSLTPPAIAGLTSPYGFCPAGSITMPITNEMMHLWVLPGVEDRFGDIEDEWLRDYLATVTGR